MELFLKKNVWEVCCVVDNNAVLNYEHHFYLSGILLSGVTNIDGGYSISESPVNIIGQGYKYPVRNGNLVGNFNISKFYIGQDPLLNYTGDHPISGSINYQDKNFGFTDGYLTEYSISASIGSIPQSNSSIVVYGDIGSGINASGNIAHPKIQIPNQGSIELNCQHYQTNRVTDFSYTLRIDRNPIYKIGSPFPVQVDRQFPILQEAAFSLDVSDAEITKIQEYLISPQQQTLTFKINNPINEQEIDTITIEKARLLSQSMRSSSDDLITVDLLYNGYVNKK